MDQDILLLHTKLLTVRASAGQESRAAPLAAAARSNSGRDGHEWGGVSAICWQLLLSELKNSRLKSLAVPAPPLPVSVRQVRGLTARRVKTVGRRSQQGPALGTAEAAAVEEETFCAQTLHQIDPSLAEDTQMTHHRGLKQHTHTHAHIHAHTLNRLQTDALCKDNKSEGNHNMQETTPQ